MMCRVSFPRIILFVESWKLSHESFVRFFRQLDYQGCSKLKVKKLFLPGFIFFVYVYNIHFVNIFSEFLSIIRVMDICVFIQL